MSHVYDIYALGNALVDLQHSVSEDFLQSQQIDKGVMTLIDAQRQESLFAAIGAEPHTSASGGSAANTAIGVASFGGRAFYACQVGDDAWGDFYIEDLKNAGVDSNPANRTNGRTGQCLVFITPDADRTLNTFLGVSGELSAKQLQPELIATSQYLYLEGYLLTSDSGFAACVEAQQLAQNSGTAVSLTLSDPAIVQFCKERFTQLVDKGVDLLFCNADEAQAFTDLTNREEAAEALAQQAKTVCVTCGADGALLWDETGLCKVPGVKVDALDTTGAGDLFAGGVLFGLTNGYSLKQAGQLGSYAAAQVVARYGPRLDMDLGRAIDRILAHFTS